MAEYRAYIVGVDGKSVRAVEFLCPDNDTAKEYAKNHVDVHDVKLWQGTEKSARSSMLPSKAGNIPTRSPFQWAWTMTLNC